MSVIIVIRIVVVRSCATNRSTVLHKSTVFNQDSRRDFSNKRSMPFLLATTTLSALLRRLFGDNSTGEAMANNDASKQSMKMYREEFLNFFPTLLGILVNRRESHPRVKVAYDHLEESLTYNVLGGKMTRGLMVVSTLAQIYGNRPLTAEEKYLAFTLGWCIEIMQAASLVADDIVDQSITRRNKPCWYKKENVKMVAVNDSFWLTSSGFILLNKAFRDHPCYVELIELFHLVLEYTEIGEITDLLFSKSDIEISYFTMERFETVVKYKTSYYTFYLPVAVALCMAGVNDKEAVEGARTILLMIGEYYQYQDDMIDCFGDPKVTGKVGTDITNKKCTWLIVQALPRANSKQRAILEANYGKSDKECVEKVKAVYEALNLRQLFAEYEEQSYQKLGELIHQYSNVLPAPVFLELRERIYKRKK